MNKNETGPSGKWYDKFAKKTSQIKHTPAGSGNHPAEHKNHTAEPGYRAAKNTHGESAEPRPSTAADAKITSAVPMFSARALPKDAKAVLDSFCDIVQGVRPMNSRQLLQLPQDVRKLSHELTDERGERRVGYMNDASFLSAYTRYFTWWNLVRLTRLFANLGADAFGVGDDDVCLDIGSGPLTAVIALWLACPRLRSKKLTWYCMDISQNALSLGEDLYLSIAARTPPADGAEAHWNIIRVKGPIGTEIRKKANLITCANVFNELSQTGAYRPEAFAEKYAAVLEGYAAEKRTILVVEPGVPAPARIISLMRGCFLASGMHITAPCPHAGACAMNGLHARMGGTAKWCNFAFTTEDAPQRLLKLSRDSNLPKERAVLSFILSSSLIPDSLSLIPDTSSLFIRVVSDPIFLPGHRIGYYACSSLGLTLAVNVSAAHLASGDLLQAEPLHDLSNLNKDAKTAAAVINV